MTREEFPKVKKGDIVTNGKRNFCVLKLQNKADFDIHGHHVGWINGFQYLDTDGFVKFQEYNNGDFKIVGHSQLLKTFLKELKKELKSFDIS
ncbi:MAG: hypothetical protein IJR29_11580 [Butyrivibrio sp.]|nr:hypothetical protein [Butyrivibrio sp.]